MFSPFIVCISQICWLVCSCLPILGDIAMPWFLYDIIDSQCTVTAVKTTDISLRPENRVHNRYRDIRKSVFYMLKIISKTCIFIWILRKYNNNKTFSYISALRRQPCEAEIVGIFGPWQNQLHQRQPHCLCKLRTSKGFKIRKSK